MIVWGGYSNSGSYLNTGGRYTPRPFPTDTWSPTSTSGSVPAGRAGHSAVWTNTITGLEMVIWGGAEAGAVDVNTGARYSPFTNTWVGPTSTSGNVPFAREFHSAVLTDTEMIVWGGSNGVLTNTGGRYLIGTDTWGAPTSTSGNVPSPRQAHSAVWTGSEMIIWGGGSPANTGGRYCGCPPEVLYRDADGDAYGNPAVSITICGASSAGYVTNNTDCDDTQATVHPGAPELCDGFDNNCNGQVDEEALIPTGLVALWKAELNANDSAGNNHGTLANGTAFTAGEVGQSFDFDGVNDYVANLGSTSTSSFVENTGVFTIEGWVRLNLPDALMEQTLLANVATTAETGFYFGTDNRGGQHALTLVLARGTSGSHIIGALSPNGVVTAGWHHLAASGDGTRVRFYVDGGEFLSPGTMSGFATGSATRPLNIGWDGAVTRFSGQIDELAIYDRTLSAGQIQALYASGASGRCGLVDVGGPGTPAATTLQLFGPWPNPASRGVNLDLHLASAEHVRADVVDIAGRRIATLFERRDLPAGSHRLHWDGRDDTGRRAAPGVYFLRVSTDDRLGVRRAVLVRASE